MSSTAPVPSSTIEVFTTPRSDPLYAGSRLLLTCVVEVDSAVDTPHVLDIVWKKSGERLENDYHVSVSNVTQLSSQSYQSGLVLYPLSTSLDTAVYNCHVEIDSNPPLLYVLRSVHTESVTVSVHGKMYTVLISLIPRLPHFLNLSSCNIVGKTE